MKLTIVPSDNFCSVDDVGLSESLISFSIPSNVWALQWNNSAGHIEYTNAPNETITELPSWATASANNTTTRLAAIKDAIDNPTNEELADTNRFIRNGLLVDCDWVVTKALEAGGSVPSAWVAYRNALRNLTTHANWPNLANNDWPTAPN
tara:strand:+ start:1030 stop:1479 length:450 start_codon:yes stop_codon:yes gene_type:complete